MPYRNGDFFFLKAHATFAFGSYTTKTTTKETNKGLKCLNASVCAFCIFLSLSAAPKQHSFHLLTGPIEHHHSFHEAAKEQPLDEASDYSHSALLSTDVSAALDLRKHTFYPQQIYQSPHGQNIWQGSNWGEKWVESKQTTIDCTVLMRSLGNLQHTPRGAVWVTYGEPLKRW